VLNIEEGFNKASYLSMQIQTMYSVALDSTTLYECLRLTPRVSVKGNTATGRGSEQPHPLDPHFDAVSIGSLETYSTVLKLPFSK